MGTNPNDQYDEELSFRKWLVLFGAFVNNVLIWGLAWGSGVFQIAFVEEFGEAESTGLVSVVPTLISTWTCLTGPVSSMLTSRFGCRSVTWIGAIVASCGLALASVTTQMWHLFITFSLIGVGAGLAYIPGSVIIVCQYFERRRALALALSSCGVGVGTFLMPPLINFLINNYRWRGACLVLSAVVLNIGASASLFEKGPAKAYKNDTGMEATKRKIIRVKMLRQPSFCCLIINNILIMSGMIAVYIHLPSYLDSVGYKDDAGAAFISIIGASILLGRVLCGFVAERVHNSVDIMYSVTLALAGLVVCIVPYANGFELLVALCILFGFTTCTFGPLLPLITLDLVGTEALSDAFGYLMVAEGVGSLLGPPVAGFLYDISGNYRISMGSSGLVIMASSAAMIIPIYRKRITSAAMEKEKPSSATISTLLISEDLL